MSNIAFEIFSLVTFHNIFLNLKRKKEKKDVIYIFYKHFGHVMEFLCWEDYFSSMSTSLVSMNSI